MEYISAYNIGDKVWIMDSNKACECEIKSIMINSYYSIFNDWNETIKESYMIDINGSERWVEIDNLFKNKNELILSL